MLPGLLIVLAIEAITYIITILWTWVEKGSAWKNLQPNEG